MRLYGLSFASAGLNSPLRLCLSVELCPLLGYLARASIDSHSLPLPSRETKFALKAYSRSRRIKSCSLAGCLKPFAVRPHSGLAFRPRLTVEEPLTPTTLAHIFVKRRKIFAAYLQDNANDRFATFYETKKSDFRTVYLRNEYTFNVKRAERENPPRT